MYVTKGMRQTLTARAGQNLPSVSGTTMRPRETQTVFVQLGTREKMEPHAHCAVSTSTKKALGLVLALIVRQTLPLQLAASETLPVNATPGIWGQMGPRAHSVVVAPIKRDWDLLLV